MSSDTDAPPGSLPEGELQQLDDGEQVVRFLRRLDHPVERVWAALTDPGELIRWLGEAEVDH